MTLFISYSSSDADVVSDLERDLESFGKKVWRDNEVTGGEAWWAAILEQIRQCDVFVFALTRDSLASEPCALEFSYAKALGIPILPVEIGDVPPESRRNHPVYSEQLVDYRHPTPAAAIALMRAVSDREASRKPLSDPLPPEPAVPYEYLLRLSSVIRMREPIPYTEQRQIIGEFRDALNRERNESVRGSIRDLLNELKVRPDTSHSVEAEIDELLARYAPRTAPADPGASRIIPPGGVAAEATDFDIPAKPESIGPPAPPEAAPTDYLPSAFAAAAADPQPATPRPDGGAGYGQPPQTGSPSKKNHRTLAIILGAVGAVFVIGGIGAAVAVAMSQGGSTPTPSASATPTAQADPLECWDGSEAAGVAECPEFSGADALQFAFPPGEGPEGGEPECSEDEPSEVDAADGAIVTVTCTWADIPGTIVSLTEWDMEPDELVSYWEDYFEWDEEFAMTVSDDLVGETRRYATTIDSGEVWLWVDVYDDLPFSAEVFSSASSGGSYETAEAAWNSFGGLDDDQLAALPGVE